MIGQIKKTGQMISDKGKIAIAEKIKIIFAFR